MNPQGTLEFIRRDPRIRVELFADYCVIDSPSDNGVAKESTIVKTLGGGGVMFLSPVHLPKGTHVEMKVFFDIMAITFEAEVVWTELQLERNQKEFPCGLSFSRIADDDLFYIQYMVNQKLHSNPGGGE